MVVRHAYYNVNIANQCHAYVFMTAMWKLGHKSTIYPNLHCTTASSLSNSSPWWQQRPVYDDQRSTFGQLGTKKSQIGLHTNMDQWQVFDWQWSHHKRLNDHDLRLLPNTLQYVCNMNDAFDLYISHKTNAYFTCYYMQSIFF